MQQIRVALSDEDIRVLDAESARTGRSTSALIREAVAQAYGLHANAEDDLGTIDSALGAWSDRECDGQNLTEGIRSGYRLRRGIER